MGKLEAGEGWARMVGVVCFGYAAHRFLRGDVRHFFRRIGVMLALAAGLAGLPGVAGAHGWGGVGVFVGLPPVVLGGPVYAPPPVYYEPPPDYYAAPPPDYYAPPPPDAYAAPPPDAYAAPPPDAYAAPPPDAYAAPPRDYDAPPSPGYYPPPAESAPPAPVGFTCFARPYECPLAHAHKVGAPCACAALNGGAVNGSVVP